MANSANIEQSFDHHSERKRDFVGHPLCVDLDGTLVRTDTLYECLASFIKTRWWLAPLILFWLVRGKGYLKRRLAQYGEFDVKTLPYNEDFLAYLTRQKRRGRRLLLVTAADQSIADAVAAHLGLFDEVLGSNETRNLRGSKKVDAILLVLQGKPFSYAGNDRTDLEIWRHAESALLVNAPKSVATRSARLTSIEEEFNNPRNIARAFVKALRPHQWLKNVLVFVPIVTANALFDMGAWIGSMVVFVGFCLTASSIYMINDLFDLSADRQHRRKRFRPFASGALPLLFGFIVPPLLLTAGLAMGALSGTLPILLTYGLCSIAYSLRLKALPLVDIFTLAALYTMRLFAGGEASGYPVSLWLLGFSCFLFLALAIVKRVAELSAAPASQGKIAGRGYFPSDLEILRMMGLASSFASCLILALYVRDDMVTAFATRPHVLWAILPLILFWQCRLWLSTFRGEMHDDPIVFAARDRVSWLVMLGVLAAFAVAHA